MRRVKILCILTMAAILLPLFVYGIDIEIDIELYDGIFPEPCAHLERTVGGWSVDRYSPLVTGGVDSGDFLLTGQQITFTDCAWPHTSQTEEVIFNVGELTEIFETQDRIGFTFSPDEPGLTCVDDFGCFIAPVSGKFDVDIAGPYQVNLYYVDHDPTIPPGFGLSDITETDLITYKYKKLEVKGNN